MPEGHTIHRLAAELNTRFAGVGVAVSSPQGRFVEGADRVDGRVFGRASAHGKHLFVDFGRGDVVHIHLGLYGRVAFGTFGGAGGQPAGTWAGRDIAYLSGVTGRATPAPTTPAPTTPAPTTPAPTTPGPTTPAPTTRDAEDDDDADVTEAAPAGVDAPPEPRGAVRIRIVGDRDYMDLRGPTACELLDPAGVTRVEARLGPDPLRRDGHSEEFVRRIRSRRVEVGALLMDQGAVAGIGNVYRAELLFRHGLTPFRVGRDVDEATLAAMWLDLRMLMRAGVRTGRIVTTRPEHRPHPRGAVRREESHYVYKRSSLPCRVCGTAVQTRVYVGRNLFWCPFCQPE